MGPVSVRFLGPVSVRDWDRFGCVSGDRFGCTFVAALLVRFFAALFVRFVAALLLRFFVALFGPLLVRLNGIPAPSLMAFNVTDPQIEGRKNVRFFHTCARTPQIGWFLTGSEAPALSVGKCLVSPPRETPTMPSATGPPPWRARVILSSTRSRPRGKNIREKAKLREMLAATCWGRDVTVRGGLARPACHLRFGCPRHGRDIPGVPST